ncbi:TIGR01244 family phosphatase [Paracoccus suum]|uniref:TIGR01244 family phosphatase n=1 Tax=Paracoccus suum TaxID=2259340 RepID=A0A344PLY8_9RHOB|nr:TIGR01244 family sulfur transferase [Paracoccus suum]AXC50393.1 TIGR01244 family phosphatase [Paracoccus suum]
MMLRRLSDDVTVSDQITVEDIPALKQAGVATLIINRPDSEVGPAEGSEAISRAAQDAGMEARYIPFCPGQLEPRMVEDFGAALARPGKAHAYCRSGTRSTNLWGLSQAGAMPTDAIISAAAAAGYDLSPIAGMIDSLARSRGAAQG